MKATASSRFETEQFNAASVSVTEARRVLSMIASVLPKASPSPLVIRLDVEGSALRASTKNVLTGLSASGIIPVRSGACPPASAEVDASRLLQIAALSCADELYVCLTPPSAVLRSGSARFALNAKTELAPSASLDRSDARSFSLPASRLAEVIRHSMLVSSRSAKVACAFLSVRPDHVFACATDGRMISKMHETCFTVSPDGAFDVVLPLEIASRVYAAIAWCGDEETQVGVNSSRTVWISSAGVTLDYEEPAIRRPPFSKILGLSSSAKLHANADEFCRAVRCLGAGSPPAIELKILDRGSKIVTQAMDGGPLKDSAITVRSECFSFSAPGSLSLPLAAKPLCKIVDAVSESKVETLMIDVGRSGPGLAIEFTFDGRSAFMRPLVKDGPNAGGSAIDPDEINSETSASAIAA